MDYKNYELNEKQDNLTHFARKVFSTDDGKRLLEELRKEFICAPVAPPGCAKWYPYYREGQNDIIRQLFKVVEAKDEH